LFHLFDFICFTGDYTLTDFGRDQAVKRCVTGALWTLLLSSSEDTQHKEGLQVPPPTILYRVMGTPPGVDHALMGSFHQVRSDKVVRDHDRTSVFP
jgi:hypothetical protein